VVRAVYAEKPLNVQSGIPISGQRAAHVRRVEHDIGVTAGLQYIAFHLAVASIVAAIAAGRIHHQSAACRSGYAVETDFAALEAEASVHGVKEASEGEVDLCCRRVELHNFLLRGRNRGATGSQDEK
jgi:hypothetical protein